MTKRFLLELIVGIIGLIAVLLFGDAGTAVITLLVVHPFIGKKKADERESQLFNKVGNVTAALTLLAAIGIYFASDIVVNGYQIGAHWLMLLVFSFLIVHGASGLVIIRRG